MQQVAQPIDQCTHLIFTLQTYIASYRAMLDACYYVQPRCILLRRRRRSFPGGDSGDQDEDLGIPGGNDGDSGSTGGGGGGDWGSDGEEEGDYFGDIANALWLWRALCVCSMLQVLFLLVLRCACLNPLFVTSNIVGLPKRINSLRMASYQRNAHNVSSIVELAHVGSKLYVAALICGHNSACLQVAHFLLLSHYKQANPTFATLSQSFFSSSVRPQPVHAP